MRIWLSQHPDAARLALRRLTATPVNGLLSLLAIGIALALPAGGQMLLANALHLSGTTSTVPQISIFMAANAERQASAWAAMPGSNRCCLSRARRPWRA